MAHVANCEPVVGCFLGGLQHHRDELEPVVGVWGLQECSIGLAYNDECKVLPKPLAMDPRNLALRHKAYCLFTRGLFHSKHVACGVKDCVLERGLGSLTN